MPNDDPLVFIHQNLSPTTSGCSAINAFCFITFQGRRQSAVPHRASESLAKSHGHYGITKTRKKRAVILTTADKISYRSSIPQCWLNREAYTATALRATNVKYHHSQAHLYQRASQEVGAS